MFGFELFWVAAEPGIWPLIPESRGLGSDALQVCGVVRSLLVALFLALAVMGCSGRPETRAPTPTAVAPESLVPEWFEKARGELAVRLLAEAGKRGLKVEVLTADVVEDLEGSLRLEVGKPLEIIGESDVLVPATVKFRVAHGEEGAEAVFSGNLPVRFHVKDDRGSFEAVPEYDGAELCLSGVFLGVRTQTCASGG